MSNLYRVTFDNGDVVEDESLGVVRDMVSLKPGTIELIDKKAEVFFNGAPLAQFDTPDEATTYRDTLAQSASQAANDQYTVAVVKVLVDPQPEGLN